MKINNLAPAHTCIFYVPLHAGIGLETNLIKPSITSNFRDTLHIQSS